MATEDDNLTVTDNTTKSRFEVTVDNHGGTLDYSRSDDHIVLIYMEVDKELEGKGIGGRLTRFALDDSRSKGLKVVPRCPFVASYIKRHPEYEDLVIEQPA
ncbi:MAG: GNAT family N-acetyltransferase [Dehalococcoidia bacterium]